jgi:catechol 2,3-dioxygenase-like lactoylglutathione lyase family enzyme
MPNLDHAAVLVSDLKTAIRFYTDKLGLRLLIRMIDANHRRMTLGAGNELVSHLLDGKWLPLHAGPGKIQFEDCFAAGFKKLDPELMHPGRQFLLTG